jgi:hypothetical protein
MDGMRESSLISFQFAAINVEIHMNFNESFKVSTSACMRQVQREMMSAVLIYDESEDYEATQSCYTSVLEGARARVLDVIHVLMCHVCRTAHTLFSIIFIASVLLVQQHKIAHSFHVHFFMFTCSANCLNFQ